MQQKDCSTLIPWPSGSVTQRQIFGCRLRPATIYDEIGVAARNIHCYTVIGFWQWGGNGADSAY